MTASRHVILLLSSFVMIGTIVAASRTPQPAIASEEAPAAWSASAAQAYLDTRSHWWQNWSGSARGHGTACLSCHTSMPIALAQAALHGRDAKWSGPDDQQAVLAGTALRVSEWDSISSGKSDISNPCVTYYGNRIPSSLGTESVMNALVLVDADQAAGRGTLSQPAQDALRYFWEQQQTDGSWLWLDFGLSPWERDGAYYGTALAAVAVGMAGSHYYNRPDWKSKIDAMRNYLTTEYPSRPLHDQVDCLWASTWLPGILSDSQKTTLIHRLLAAQGADGGWSLPALGVRTSGSSGWSAQETYPVGSISDGYATGLVVLALKRSGIRAANPNLARAVAWLSINERSGSWPTSYINGARDPQSDVGGFMRDASTSFAVLALTEPDHR